MNTERHIAYNAQHLHIFLANNACRQDGLVGSYIVEFVVMLEG